MFTPEKEIKSSCKEDKGLQIDQSDEVNDYQVKEFLYSTTNSTSKMLKPQSQNQSNRQTIIKKFLKQQKCITLTQTFSQPSSQSKSMPVNPKQALKFRDPIVKESSLSTNFKFPLRFFGFQVFNFIPQRNIQASEVR